MIYAIIFVLLLGLLNHIRGGFLNKFYQNAILWKVVATVGVAASAYFLLGLIWWHAIGLGIAWFLFMLYTLGAWHDIGLLPADYSRGGLLKSLYVFLGEKIDNQTIVDILMMFVRGWFSVIIFAWIAFIKLNPWLVFLALPCAMVWTLGYVADRLAIKQNYAEYFSGIFIGIAIVAALAF